MQRSFPTRGFVLLFMHHNHGVLMEILKKRGCIEGAVPAEVLSSRRRKERQDGRKPGVSRPNLVRSG
jgi:hypothetical protein